jgi:hypothetical protein
MRRRTCWLMISTLLTGCATYQPPNLPREQTAVLSLLGSGRFLQMIEFKYVDGKPLTTASALGFSKARRPVVLAPGKHKVAVRYLSGLSEGYTELWLIAEPGGFYELPCRSEGYKFICWIQDKETKKPVGGRVGSDDEPPDEQSGR